MPLFYQHNINDSTKLAVWHINENEDFFLKKVTIINEVTHPQKRLQHLAGRYLLQIIHPDFPLHLIEIAESRKPLLSDGKFNFSISHCGNFAAAIVSENKPVGIDVELVRPKITLVKNKFLGAKELSLLPDNVLPIIHYQLLTLFWSAKETIYKWHGKSPLSFKNNMSIDELFFENGQGFINAHFIKEQRIDLKIEFRFFDTLCVAWVLK
ncbi:MAG: 4'-phosphopantetheinyl transferase superfamily protein [Ginsengibacter sp.]